MARMCILVACLMVIGCSRAPAPSQTTSTQPKKSAVVEVPDSIFVEQAPEGAGDVKAVKASAKAGQTVVLRGRIGGSSKPFSENMAIFTIMDANVPACGEGEGKEDHCPTPYDYCCTPRDVIKANIATIQIVDDAGKPIRTNVQDLHGMTPLLEIVVKGVVERADGASILVVNAQEIYVKLEGVSRET